MDKFLLKLEDKNGNSYKINIGILINDFKTKLTSKEQKEKLKKSINSARETINKFYVGSGNY